jgi:hypothetical protein
MMVNYQLSILMVQLRQRPSTYTGGKNGDDQRLIAGCQDLFSIDNGTKLVDPSLHTLDTAAEESLLVSIPAFSVGISLA